MLHGVMVARVGTPDPAAGVPLLPEATISPSSRQQFQVTGIERVIERAVQVIGTREEALRWLGTPVRALNYATPISLLNDAAGSDQVEAVLTKLENGVL